MYRRIARKATYEKPYATMNGIAMLLLADRARLHPAIAGLVRGPRRVPVRRHRPHLAIAFIVRGFFMLQPNEGAVLMLFGDYLGTERKPGLRWTWPWNTRRRVSVRARNQNIETLKVNDKRGNPVEIGAVVVWRVEDTAQATFDVEDFENFVRVQSESALRHVATGYNYDTGEDHEIERGHAARRGRGGRRGAARRAPGARAARGREGRGGEAHAPRLRARRSPARCCAASRPKP